MKNKRIHKPKHIIRELKKIAKTLKPMTYQCLDKFYRPFWQDAEGNFHNGPAEEGEAPRRMITAMITEHPWNHGRRLKRAFKQYGEAGAMGYIMAFQKPKEEIIQKEEEIKNPTD